MRFKNKVKSFCQLNSELFLTMLCDS